MDEEDGPELEVADRTRPDPEQAAAGRDLARQLEGALRELRPEHRTALLLRFRDELAYEEIAEVMGIPLGTVKTFIYRARQELAKAAARGGFAIDEREAKPERADDVRRTGRRG